MAWLAAIWRTAAAMVLTQDRTMVRIKAQRLITVPPGWKKDQRYIRQSFLWAIPKNIYRAYGLK